MTTRLLPALFSLSLSSAALAAPHADPSQRMIVNGQEESGFPSAVALIFEFGQFRQPFCSASLITPRMVLTAAHCTEEIARQFGVSVDQVVQVGAIGIGQRVSGPNLRTVPFADVVNHPRYSSRGGMGGSPQFDVGIIELAEEVTDVEPVWFETGDLSDAAGTAVRSVGWGNTSFNDQGSAGTKRSAILNIDRVDDQNLYSTARNNPNGANVCSGDSGGPQYFERDDGTLIQWGVHSFVFGLQGGDICANGQSGSFRTDTGANFVLNQIERIHGTTDRCDIYGYYDPPTGPRKCHTDCPEPDPICVADLDGDGFVSQEEFDEFDLDGDGVLSEDELNRAERQAARAERGCTQAGSTPGSLLLLSLLGLVGLRRRA